ncbi:MAG: MtrB/PioB family outer membrane beta-barrel protein, partial [Rhodoferax sp.]
NMFGQYELDTKSAVRVNYVVQEFRSDDWQWGYNGVPFVYSDNTTVSSNLTQSLSYVGVTYIYKFN